MNKTELERKLQAAFDTGFDPYGKPPNSGPITVVPKEGEETRITVAYRTVDDQDRQHNHQFIYSLEEAYQLLNEDSNV